MSIPSTIAPINVQDFTMRAVDIHREYAYSSSTFDTTSSGYFLQEALYRYDPTPVGSSKALNDPTNSIDNSYKHIIWKSIDQRYYRFPYDLYATFEHSDRSRTTKNLYLTASVLTMPYLDFGLRIKPGSLVIENASGVSCYEDGYGNLRVAGFDTSSLLDRSSLVGYWGFNELFRNFLYNVGTIEKGELSYESWTHSVDAPSYMIQVRTTTGVTCSLVDTGHAISLEGTGFVLTPPRDEFNFLDSQDYTLSLWAKLPTSQSVLTTTVNDLLTKNGVVYKTTYGIQPSTLLDGTTLSYKHYSSSFKDELTNVYPYSIQVYNQTSLDSGKIRFAASNGITTLVLTSSISIADGLDAFHHITVTKSGSLYSLYLDGSPQASSSLNLGLCSNEHCLMFGSRTQNLEQALSGSLDEIRIYEYAASPTEVSSLYDSASLTQGISIYQNDVIGNVFHRRGVVTLTTLLPAYRNMMRDAWNIRYRGTHTIYQYEALCRIRKGDFNLSMNPTARVHPKSDRLIDDFTGSLLKPYATTIGLYNANHELMAIAKLGQPLKMRDDVDINISVQWDA